MKTNISNPVQCLLLCISVLICGCKGISTDRNLSGNLACEADLLQIFQDSGSYTFRISNPWKPNLQLAGYETADSTAFKRVIVTTNCHAALFAELGIADRIAGICEIEYVSDSTINALYSNGHIANCGSAMSPTIETIIDLNPDAIFVSPFENASYGSLEKLGIPLIECADYMETSPLGRAEWILFFARLMGVPEKGDSLYNAVRKQYLHLCSLGDSIKKCQESPLVMTDMINGSAWYVPGGKSTIGRLIEDAGGTYIFNYIDRNGSVPLSKETVLDKAQNADIWLVKNSTSGTMTYSGIERDWSSYKLFKPFNSHNIWVCPVYQVPYFEQTAFHPEYLLEEFIAIFYPTLDIRPRHPVRYYTRLQYQ